MEGRRFDAWSRDWAKGTSRRQTLQLFAASLGCAAWTRAQSGSATAQAACAQDADCAAPDGDPCTGASCVAGACAVFTVDCVTGYVCCGNGQCCGGGTGSCATDADCPVADADPCAAARCDNGFCVATSVACAPGFACCGRGGCCPIGGECAADADCGPFGDDPCLGGRCVNGACVPDRVPCPPGQVCHDGACVAVGSA